MAKPTSPRAARSRDWEAVLRALREEEAAVTPESRALWLQGKGPDPAPGWNEDYLHAIQKTLEQRDPDHLLKMLDARVPMSALLFPLIAEVIRDVKQGRSAGRPSKLTLKQDEVIRWHYGWLTTHGREKPVAAQEWLAKNLGVSIDTIKRSLKRTKPKP